MTAISAGARPVTAWSPLRVRAFRMLWIGTAAANLGAWMQIVGAQWMLVADMGGEALVALVHTATTLPVLLLAMPAGALADIVNRTRLLVGAQLFIAAVAVSMTVLGAIGELEPGMLLMATFALGAGAALSAPAIGALIPDLVPRAELVEASALGAISVNVARAVGPAIAGLIIAATGATTVFALNAAAALGFATLLVFGRIGPKGVAEDREHFAAALYAGGRYVRHTRVVGRILLRAVLFVVPATAIWALLPLFAGRDLGLGPDGYGLLLGALGVGAILGAVLLPRLPAGPSTNGTVAVASLAYAGTLVAMAVLRRPVPLTVCMVPAGVAWVAILANVNAQIQLFLPGWVRARGLAVYQVFVIGGQAIAAGCWGLVGHHFGLRAAFLAAAGLLVAGVLTAARWPLPDTRGINQNPAVYWPEPHLVMEPEPGGGPVLVTVTYTVRPERQDAFVAAMTPIGQARRRTGASRYRLFREGEVPDRFVEAFLVPSWEEHMRQHYGRLTLDEKAQERRAVALAEGRPVIRHMLPLGLQ
ncbi:MFS transporter [Dactylosporangium sp. NPDC049525]|uniref:MFS transporter n=1 Tax=Dactylosporangium sp. NPDC049525 TaxID=3154730 RepID=UPI003434730A